jgi:hypothetical protein
VSPFQLFLPIVPAAAEALLGRDQHCVKYPRAYRQGKLETPAAASA